MNGMKAITRIFLILLGVFLTLFALASPALAYNIVGNSVIQEDAVSKLQVTPATAWSPSGKDFEQTFVLTNKTSSPANVFVAYKFDKNLVAGSVNAYSPPVFDWVENQSKTCNPPNAYTYTTSIAPIPNPNTIHCYHHSDNNTPGNPADDYNTTIFDTNFSTGDLGTNTVNIKNYVMVSGDSWSDVTNLFSAVIYLNDTLYYLPTPIAFSANQSLTWKLKYTPDPSDVTRKWEMVFYTGTDASCLLSGTCSYVQWLDPWWDSAYGERYPVNFDNNHSATDLNDVITLRNLHTAGWACNADNNKLALVWNNGASKTSIDIDIKDGTCGGDMNIAFRSQFGIPNASAFTSSDTNGYYFYARSTTTASVLRDPANVYSFYEGAEDGNIYTAPVWTSAWGAKTNQASTASKYRGAYGVSSPGTGEDGSYATTPAKSTWVYEAKVKASSMSKGMKIGIAKDSTWQTLICGITQNAGNFGFITSADAEHPFTVQALTNTWYNMKIVYDGSKCNYYMQDTTGTTIDQNLLVTQDQTGSSVITWLYANGTGTVWWDDVEFYTTASNPLKFSIGAKESNNATPDVNFIYPNTAGLNIAGSQTIDFNFSDSDFNSAGNYRITLKTRRPDTNAMTTILNDVNAFAYCNHMDSNATKKECTTSYNFSLNLAKDVNYVLDVNVTDDQGAVGSKTSPYFQVLKVVLSNQVMARTTLLDLALDGVNYGVNSEGWIAGATKNKTMNAPNVGRKQYVIVRKLRDNSALQVSINSVSVGTIVADSSDPKTWQLYAFPITSTLLHGNPQTVNLTAPGAQGTTYVDYIALADSVDGNIFSGGEALTYLWDVNYNGIAPTTNQFALDQNGVITYTDANSVAMTGDVNYVAVVYPTASLDMNVFGFVKVVAGSATYLTDTNKTMIDDSTNPVINSISMSYFDVITGRSYHFDSNSTDLYWSNAILSIEGVDYDLNVQALGTNDRNAYGDFTFVANGNYSSILEVFDQVDRNNTYPFTIRASDINLLSSSELNDSNWSRTNAVAIASSAQYTNISFRKDFNFIATGTANITYFDHNYNLFNGSTSTGRGGVINGAYHRANKSTVVLPPLTTLNGVLVASDMNGNVTLQDYITYDVNGAILTQWKNTGVDDKRLVWVSPQDINSTLTGFWVKVAVRTPFNANTYKVLFKECTNTPDFTLGTCVAYTTIDIYSQTDSNYNGGVYPTADTDADGLKDAVYFKVPTLGDHMYLIDLTATPESAWSTPGGSPGGGGGNSGSDTGTPPDTNNNIVQQATTGLFAGFDGFAGALGSLVGGLIDWTNLQFTRLNVQGVFQGENLFTIISLAVLGVIVFFLIPKAQSKTTKKSFGVRV